MGDNYTTIDFDDVSDFPENGFLYFNFGKSTAFGPVKYLFKNSSTQLLIDSNYTFPIDSVAGTSVMAIPDKSPYVPENPQDLGVFYLTDSVSGRIAASNTIDFIKGTGLKVVKTILYPGTVGLGNSQIDIYKKQSKVNDGIFIWGNQIDVNKARGK